MSLDQQAVVSMLSIACDAPPEAVAAIQRHCLAWLVEGHAATLADISERSGIGIEQIKDGVRGLSEAGRIEIDSDRVVGVGGLTLTPTRHSLELVGVRMHTWCALDAIGIPTALGLDAVVTTSCPHCEAALRLKIHKGQPAPNDIVRLFCPTAACSDVRADFCAAANLFCDYDHVDSWIASAGPAGGEVLDLTQTAGLGRTIWGRYRTD